MNESMSKSSNESLLQSVQDTSSTSRSKKKLSAVAIFTLIVVAIITLIKHKPQSKPVSYDPLGVIKAICWIPYLTEHPESCINSISSLYYADDPPLFWSNRASINPSIILMASLYASVNELSHLSSSPIVNDNPKTVLVLRECQRMLKLSLTRLDQSMRSLGNDPDENLFATLKAERNLQMWISEAHGKVQRCVDRLEMIESSVTEEMRRRTGECQQHMSNSIRILENIGQHSFMKMSVCKPTRHLEL